MLTDSRRDGLRMRHLNPTQRDLIPLQGELELTSTLMGIYSSMMHGVIPLIPTPEHLLGN